MGKWIDRLKEKNIKTLEPEGDKTDTSPFVGFVSLQTGDFEENFSSGASSQEGTMALRRLELEEKLRFLQACYNACVRLRDSYEHRYFSADLLFHEAQAFERMERQREELLIQLSQLTPRGD